MQAFLDWAGRLPLGTLYGLLGLMAFIEAVFPPVPADVLVAFGSFLAARQNASLAVTIVVIVGGMSVGSALVYWLARRYGAAWMHAQLKRFGVDSAERQLEALYGRYGLSALFIGRFVPGLRMFVPPVAGMLRVPFALAISLITLASVIWYGMIAALAFRIGSDWEMLRFATERLLRRVGLTAAAVLALALIVGWVAWRQRRFKRESRAERKAEE